MPGRGVLSRLYRLSTKEMHRSTHPCSMRGIEVERGALFEEEDEVSLS
jgi:hypothetical protein